MLSAASLLAVALTISAGAQTSSPPPEPPDRPFTHIFQNLGRDIRALPSRNTAWILAIGGASALVLHPADDNLSAWSTAHGPSAYTGIGRVAGDGWVQSGVAVGTYVVGLAVHDRETVHIGADLIRGQFLNGLITRGLKSAVGRTRPSGGGHSFPSGHSSTAFVTASVVDSHFGHEAGAAAYAGAAFISWTRLRDNDHWLTDALVGGTIGLIVGHTVTRGHALRSWAVTPSPLPGGIAVYVTRR